MKFNGKNIITDDDITLTGENIGEKLSDVLGELQSKTKKLESNVKWIYKYGGVGSGGGGGDSASNKISKLDVSNNSELLGLYVNNNKLTELDISNNKNLKKPFMI